jgi:hypothetical protein
MEKQQSTENEQSVKKISDMALATYIMCDDTVNKLAPMKILRTEKVIGGDHRSSTPKQAYNQGWQKSVFVFLLTPELEEKILRFFNHEARVDPVQFSESFRSLKSYTKQG